MIFKKDTWERVTLKNVMTFKNGFNFNKGNLFNDWKVIGVKDFQQHFHPKLNELEILVSDKFPSKDYLLEVDDIVFVRSNGNSDLVGRTLLIDSVPSPITFSAFCIRGRFNSNNIQPLFFAFLSKSDRFKLKLKNLVHGTNITNISQGLLQEIEIPLPPLEEQKQIAALFQSIEAAIEHVVNQEKKLNILQKQLCNGLVSTTPVFGDLLSDGNCNYCTFEDITDCIEKHDKKPLERGITRFVGLEFIEADDFNLQGYGNIEEGTTFTKCFSTGDVLFGKRRAYLKKVAIADFDGICSSDILVFRSKSKKMLSELLPYYISSDVFMQQAVSTSAGSLSPRTKWRDLAVLEICIPDLKTQKVIVDVFQQLQLTQDQLKQQKTTLKNLKQKLLSEILG